MNKKTELEVLSPARSLINGETLTEENVGEAIDLALQELTETGDNSKIDATIKNIVGLGKITQFSLCKIFYGYQKWWDETGQSEVRGDTFKDYMDMVHDIKSVILERYISVWRHRELKDMPEGVEYLPLTFQVDITTKLLDEGFTPDEEQWEELMDAQNTGHLSQIIREIKGKEPTKASYMLYWERSGDLVVWHQDQRFQIGYIDRLDMKDTDDALERKVLEKIEARLTNSGLKATKR